VVFLVVYFIIIAFLFNWLAGISVLFLVVMIGVIIAITSGEGGFS
jgi:hypothetical protein